MTDEKPPGAQPDDETQPVRPVGTPVDQPAADAPAPATAAYAVSPDPVAEAPAKRGFRERLRLARSGSGHRAFSLGALIASALAGIIVGGLGVTAVHAITHDGPDRGNVGQQRGPMGGNFGGRGGSQDGGPDDGRGPSFGQGGPMPGQVQPTTPPEDDDSSSGSSS